MKINSQTPFTNRSQEAANGIHGDFDQRNRSINVPLKEVSADMQLYNSVFNSNGTPTVNNRQTMPTGQNIIASASTIPQQIAKVSAVDPSLQNMTYSNPKAVTQNEPDYSFLEDTGSNNDMSGFEALKNDPNRNNFFGTYKRTNPSFNARIEQAETEGRSKKVARLKKRQNNFNRNQGDAPSNI
tara:strand:- start:223 stop:774 length:552 start_codon:yes stop_codon:yes gene_type:complete